MNCVETQKEIQSFLNWELNDEDAEEFIAHVYECPICKEELAIQYLIAEGMKHLEDGSAFDLNHELADRLDSSMVNIHKKQKFNFWMLIMQGGLVMAMIFMCIFVLY